VPVTNAIIEIHLVLLFTLHNIKNVAYHIMEVLIFCADKLMAMGNSKNLRVFNFAILLKWQTFDALEIYGTCFTALFFHIGWHETKLYTCRVSTKQRQIYQQLESATTEYEYYMTRNLSVVTPSQVVINQLLNLSVLVQR